MSGVLGVEPWTFTLRQLSIMFDAKILHDWDQTHLVATHLVNLPVFLSNMFGKRRTKPTSFLDNHHLRKSQSRGLVLTPDNMHALKGLFTNG